jgi:CRP/FNR family transcriptional regulator, nitrogen oxide reductase regulator
MLLEGRVKLAQVGPVGRRVILHFVRPPELFGYALAVDRRVYSAAAHALEDSQALAWDAGIMDRLMLEHPAMALNGFHLLAERVQQTWTCLRGLAVEPVEQRTARALLRLAPPVRREGKDRKRLEVALALSQLDLAEHVGTSPYTVNRILRRWEQRGLVDVGRERVRIRRPHGTDHRRSWP